MLNMYALDQKNLKGSLMNTKLIHALTLLFLLSSSMSMQARRPRRDKESSTADTAVKVGLAAGAIAGAYAFYDWWTTPTDAQVLQTARNTYYALSNRYGADLTTAKELCGAGWHTNTPLSEATVHAVAAQLLDADRRPIDTIIHATQTSIDELHAQYDALDKQITTSESASARQEMEDLCNSIDRLTQDLTRARDLLRTHRAYLKLRILTEMLHTRYAQECRALETYAHDRYSLREQLRSCVITSNPNTVYPYLVYAENLRADYQQLEAEARTLSPSLYPQLAHRTKTVIHLLDQLKGLIHSDDEYLASLRDYDRKQLEQQRIEAQRQQAAAQNRQARALERQNNIRVQQQYAAYHCCHPHCGPVCVEYVEVVPVAPVPTDLHLGFNFGWWS